jgi:hypothetical protein
MLMVTSGWAADLPSDQVSWMAFSPGERNTAKVAKDTSTSPLVVSNRFAALDTSDSGLGPQDRTPGPRAGTSPCHCPIADPHRQLSTPVPLRDRTAACWDVERARSEAEARSQTCGRELDFTSKDITVCAIQETWLDPAIDTVMTQGSAM